MRLIDADALKKHIIDIFEIEERIDKKWAVGLKYSLKIIDNTPTVEARPQGEWIEIKHRLNLLIGVLYSNQLISESDLDYIEDSIKKLMKGDKAMQNE